MTAPPTTLLTGAEARAADEAAVAAGTSWDQLLARAGAGLARGVVAELQARCGGVYGRQVLLVAGKGDNGGDAWVAAARLRDRGVACTVLAVHGVDVDTSPHSGRARDAWLSSGGRTVSGVEDRDAVERVLRSADLRVDAVLGTGLRGAPRGPAEVGIRICNDGGGPVVACDVPSGVDADTGAVAGEAVRADRTVTFGAAKRGLVLHPGAARAGVVTVADLGPAWTPTAPAGWAWSASETWSARPELLAPGADKHARGRVLVVAGSGRYAGAAALCAAAAVRAGAGLVTLATTAPGTSVLVLEPGVMVVALPATDPSRDGGAGGPSPEAVTQVLALAADVDVVVLGPGCGHGPGTRALADALLDGDRPLVLDADGLNVFRGDADALRRPAAAYPDDGSRTGLRLVSDDGDGVSGPSGGEIMGEPAPLILTPHHRELARLAGVEPDDAASRRAEVTQALAERLDALVVGKGPGTVVADPWSREVTVVTAGGPALGSGGTGDVLAGMIGAAVAASWVRDPDHTAVGRAVVAATHRHAVLGDRAGARSGGRATARDLLDLLPALLADLTESRP